MDEIMCGCQENRYNKTHRFFTMCYTLFCIVFLWSAQALAQACSPSITANTPTVDFVIHNNGTVTHTKTGLMWKQCSEGLSGNACATGIASTYSWQGALLAAQLLNVAGFAGFNDWRLPNKKELQSIVERQCFLPAINTVVFPATAISSYWSASPDVTGGASKVNFDYGFTGVFSTTAKFYLRLVRGGQ